MHQRQNTFLPRAALVAALLAAAPWAAAHPDDGMAVYGALGSTVRGPDNSRMGSIGVLLPWRGLTPWTPGSGSSWSVDVFLSQWQVSQPVGGGHRGVTQLGAAALWRHRLAEGASPWFVEAGLGATVMDRLYATPERRFSTRFNFVTQLAVGRSFGAEGRHEVSLRLQHFSNAGIKAPNPGENFLQLRYAWRF